MKFTITVSQDRLLELAPKAKLIDGVILDYVYWFCTSPSFEIEAKRLMGDDGLKYTWLDYEWLLKDMPILGIRARSALTPVFHRLEEYGFIKSFSPDHRRKFIALLPKIDGLFIKTNRTIHKNEQHCSQKRTHHSTNDQGTKSRTTKVEKTVEKPERIKKLKQEIQKLADDLSI